ncbi:NERD domain-containing protein/DEAD/DEAH box helicase [Chryseobacterium sp.]|uniref:NERD domain-containing protein/DEAD/DEAH box helicase n=1 Tax=Chryseobacterium sp. TaxID=1871047 RepID=UPI0012A9BD84|nr:NERD domain-containing protein/DEAD/DEAH box helicase [Chryseobacterium sp.]QFG53191.1 AAA family ATPase [Chryseobacterium sp.]
MAVFYPSIQDILRGKVTPEPGELHLLNFLEKTLNDDYEVFFNPYMNGDRPDVIIIKPNQGILIIEVKDYNLKHYEIDAKTKNWKVLANNGKYLIKSPVQQVLKYKDNLFDLHVNELLSLKVSDIRNANMISCAVYFHNANEDALDKLLVRPFEKDSKYLTFLKYNILLLGSDSLNDQKFLSLLRRRHLAPGQLTSYFPEHLHTKIKRFMLPPYHQKTDGKHFTYNGEQQKLIYDTERKNIRIKGVVGSGKTTVPAARAVELHKRTEGEILILSYNITLRNYLKDKLSQVRENFSWTAFTILNYHIFINNELNNLQVDVTVPAEFNEWPDSRTERYFEDTYYSNTLLFEEHKDKLKKFSVILIDEIQDYKSKWMEILKTYFLEEGGYYMVLGDDKQNIYGNPVLGKEMPVNVQGRPSLL